MMNLFNVRSQYGVQIGFSSARGTGGILIIICHIDMFFQVRSELEIRFGFVIGIHALHVHASVRMQINFDLDDTDFSVNCNIYKQLLKTAKNCFIALELVRR